MKHYFLIPLVGLAGCMSPEEACIKRATHDLNVVDALIVETSKNLSRGYAVRTSERISPSFNWCIGGAENSLDVLYCRQTETKTVKTPVAIDPVAEKRKLATLKTKRKQLARDAAAAEKTCRAGN
ncbi:MAG: hypothetical protein ACPGVK_05770 [Halocynthiibacter sp.]